MAIKLDTPTLNVLSAANMEGHALKLTGQLTRPQYVAVNKVIEAAGGKWNKRAGAHIFEGEAADAIEPILLTGEYSNTKQDLGQFDTPVELAAEVVIRACISPGMWVLEPNAGKGALAIAAHEAGGAVACYEIDQKRIAQLAVQPFKSVTMGDFLTFAPVRLYERVVMNPPFAKQADIHHVLHALKFLRPGGRLVAIMSASVLFRENRLTVDFRKQVADLGGTFLKLPEGAFASAGTQVRACMLIVDVEPVNG